MIFAMLIYKQNYCLSVAWPGGDMDFVAGGFGIANVYSQAMVLIKSLNHCVFSISTDIIVINM